MIHKWNDGNNEIFSCDPNLEEANKFKASKRSNWIKQFLKFNNNESNDASDNVSPNLLVPLPLSLVIDMIFSCVDISDVGVELHQWAKEYQQCSNLKGVTLWDRRWMRMMSFELPFIQKYKETFFSPQSRLSKERGHYCRWE